MNKNNENAIIRQTLAYGSDGRLPCLDRVYCRICCEGGLDIGGRMLDFG